MSQSLSELSKPYVARFEDALKSCLATRYATKDTVAESVRYVLDAGGKRVRPVLCLLTAEAFGKSIDAAMSPALAVEFIHTYSLVHDDLPCMDDDDLRRGRPTAHKVFGDANALLTGDALLTDAFSVLAESALGAEQSIALVRELASAAGGGGMVLGQSLDLLWTARPGATLADLDTIHLKKTGYLLGGAAAMGAIAGGASSDEVSALREFGRFLGLAFQVLDDVLDDSPTTGKSAGKDLAAGKLTYLSLMSREVARQAADVYTAKALGLLTSTRADAAKLKAFATGLLARDR